LFCLIGVKNVSYIFFRFKDYIKEIETGEGLSFYAFFLAVMTMIPITEGFSDMCFDSHNVSIDVKTLLRQHLVKVNESRMLAHKSKQQEQMHYLGMIVFDSKKAV